MNCTEFLKESNAFRHRLLDFKEALNKEYTEVVQTFIKASSPVERLKVYEEDSTTTTRRKYKRFVVYNLEPLTHSRSKDTDAHSVIIQAGGWWLDNESIPRKWDTLIVAGNYFSSTKLKLSEDQTHHPHPDAKKGGKP